MLNIILSIKFVHMIAMAIMLGAWLCNALFMVLAYRSAHPPILAVATRFVVKAELVLMAPAVALQPLAGFPLAVAIGAPIHEYWIVVSVAIYGGVAAAWLANVVIEMRMKQMAEKAAFDGMQLPAQYQRLFQVWSLVALAGLAGMVAIMALMLWQPEWSS
jgi:uncharacterized membrane protein